MAFDDRFAPANQLLIDPDNPTDAGVEAGSRAGALQVLKSYGPQGQPGAENLSPRYGSQPALVSPKKKIDEDDYADLIGGKEKSSQVAGEGAGASRIGEQDYADLVPAGSPSTQKPVTGQTAVPSSIQTFLHDPLGIISRHPVEAGAIAAAIAYPALGFAPAIGSALGSLIRTYGPPLVMGTAIGKPDIVTAPLHYLLRLSGLERGE